MLMHKNIPIYCIFVIYWQESSGENVVSNEMANRMSLFYAEATPMLKILSDTTTQFVTSNKELPLENTTECLGAMANICRVMIENE